MRITYRIETFRPSTGLRDLIISLFAMIVVSILILLPAEIRAMKMTREWNSSDINLIAIPENSPKLFAVMTPALARLRDGENQPLLLSVSDSPRPATIGLLNLLAPKNPYVRTYFNHLLFPPWSNHLHISPDLTRTSLYIAQRFWEKSDQAILVSKNDNKAMILGSALAAHREVPLVVYGAEEENKPIERTLNKLQVNNVLLVKEGAEDIDYWADELEKNIELLDAEAPEERLADETVREEETSVILEQNVEYLGTTDVEERLAAEIGKEEVKAIVLARTPQQGHTRRDASAWLAPYYSLIRNACVAMTDSNEADEATSQVMRLIEEHDLSPRSVAILGDEESIAKKTFLVSEDKEDEEKKDQDSSQRRKQGQTRNKVKYRVKVEPCMPDNTKEIPSFGVGRIPFSSVEKAVTFLTRGFVRDQLLADTKPQAMITANAEAEDENEDEDEDENEDDTRGLSLAETMARLSAAEFENVGLQTEDFYGDSVKGKEAEATAQEANLIIYHGHKGNEDFLPKALEPATGHSGRNEPVTPENQGHQEYPEDRHHDTAHPDNPHQDQNGTSRQNTPHNRQPPGETASNAHHNRTAPGDTPSRHDPYDNSNHWDEEESIENQRVKSSEQLQGLPVVIFQSCSSLGDRFLKRTHPFGGVAKIGTDTSVHSASGAAFTKTFVDRLLYHDATLGEALRDARIYFFLLQKLKNNRGHSQQTKSQRAALSFQLWGDPELRAFPQEVEKPRRNPATIEFSDSDTLTVSIPPGKDKEVRTDDYFARVFPDAQVAGIVMSKGDDEPRRVAPIHFFRTKLPEEIDDPASGRLYTPEDDSANAFFEIDELHQHIYILYYPEEKKYTDKTFQLRFPKRETDDAS